VLIKILMKIIVVLIMSLFAHNVWALTIAYPIEGDTFYAGSQLTVIVKPDTNEKFETVLFGIYPMSYDPSRNEYSYSLTIPKYLSGHIDDLIVIASHVSGNVTELRRGIFVKLPSNVVLQSIVAGDAGDDFVSMRKMPDGSNATDVERYETRQLTTYGRYSDGVNRELTSSASGTTYSSSDETIVKVNSEGKMAAQGLGKAKITVKNGNYSATVDVIVKPYKK